jgi:GT2 family glycosyltransferase
MNKFRISVVLPTRNPHRGRLAEVLAGFARQTLPAAHWELCVIDNGSTPALQAADLAAPVPLRIAREPRAGLLWARLRGIRETHGDYLLFIDDDTIPDDNLLAAAVEFMDAHPRVGTAGGRIDPRFESSPPPWIDSVAWLLALRNNGPEPLEWHPDSGTDFPYWTPIGAGLLARRAALVPGYLDHVGRNAATIERISWAGQGAGGTEDKDLVLQTLRAGWSTGYAPAMRLIHIIPANRLQASYFETLLPRVQKLWAQTQYAHGFAPRPPIHPATLPIRIAKAWLILRAWRSPERRFGWLAMRGYLSGLAECHRHGVRYAEPTAPSTPA